jgi:hypothetical protein
METAVNAVLPHARPARSDEVTAIARLVNTAFQVEAFFKRGDRTTVAEIRDLMTRGEFLVVNDGECVDRLAGCVYVEREAERAYFGMLAIDPAIHVVNLRAELPPFYQRLGYETIGTLPFPDDGSSTRRCHFIVMSKRL